MHSNICFGYRQAKANKARSQLGRTVQSGKTHCRQNLHTPRSIRWSRVARLQGIWAQRSHNVKKIYWQRAVLLRACYNSAQKRQWLPIRIQSSMKMLWSTWRHMRTTKELWWFQTTSDYWKRIGQKEPSAPQKENGSNPQDRCLPKTNEDVCKDFTSNIYHAPHGYFLYIGIEPEGSCRIHGNAMLISIRIWDTWILNWCNISFQFGTNYF